MLALAQARLATAEANLVAAQAGPTAEQLAVAQSQVDLAQAAASTNRSESPPPTRRAFWHPRRGQGTVRSTVENVGRTAPATGIETGVDSLHGAREARRLIVRASGGASSVQ